METPSLMSKTKTLVDGGGPDETLRVQKFVRYSDELESI